MKQNLYYHAELKILSSCTRKALPLLTCCHVAKKAVCFSPPVVIVTVATENRSFTWVSGRPRVQMCSFQAGGVHPSQGFNYRHISPEGWTNSSKKNHWIECLLLGFLLGPVENSDPHLYGNVLQTVRNLALKAGWTGGFETWLCFNEGTRVFYIIPH